MADLAHGWRVFWSYRWVVVVVGAFSFIVMVWRGAEEVMGPVLAREIYGGAAGWALIMTFQSIGLLLGALVASRLRVRRPLVIGLLATLALPLWLITLALGLPLIWVARARLEALWPAFAVAAGAGAGAAAACVWGMVMGE